MGVAREEGGIIVDRLTVRQSESEEAYLSCEKCGKKDFSECWDEMDCQKTAIDRLAAIEDILGDEYDLNRLLQLVSQRMTMREDVSERMKLVGNMPIDRLRELVEADLDGRCFISPVKVGQTVWFVRDPKRHPENIAETCVEKVIHKRTGSYMKLACNSMYETACSSIGKTVFLTREAAEAAMKNGPGSWADL